VGTDNMAARQDLRHVRARPTANWASLLRLD